MKQLILLLMLFGILGQAFGAIVDADRCKWGPSYWCQNIGTARECGAIEHCKTKYWNVQVQVDRVCKSCKGSVQELVNVFKHNETEQGAQQALVHICEVVSLPERKQKCKDLVIIDFALILEELLTHGNHTFTCQALGLCFAAEKENSSYDKVVMRRPNLEQVTLKNEKQLEAELDVVNHILQNPTKKPSDGKDLCMKCKKFSDIWKNMIKQGMTIDKIVNKVADFYCMLKPSNQRKKCAKYVSMVIGVALNQLQHKTPAEICQDIYFCAPWVSSKLSLLISKEHNGDPSEKYCNDCTSFMYDLQHALKSLDGLSLFVHLQDYVLQWCNTLGFGISQACVVKAPGLLKKARLKFEALNINLICSAIKMCPDGSSKTPTHGNLCNDCSVFIRDWQAINGNDPSAISAFIQYIDSYVCSKVPSIFRHKCHSEVKKMKSQIITLLATKDARSICAEFYMCTGLKSKEPKRKAVNNYTASSTEVATNKQNTPGCTLCKMVVQELDKFLQGNKTEAAIISVLEKACSFCHDNARVECTIFIKTYGVTIVDLLVNEVKSGTLCTAFGLCTTQQTQAVKETSECDTCQVVVREICKILADQATQDRIRKYTQQICSSIEGAVLSECVKMVDQIWNEMFKFLLQQLRSKTFCADLGLCSKSKVTPCEVCYSVTTHLRNFALKKGTAVSLQNVVKKLCGNIFGGERQACIIENDMYGSEIKLLIQIVRPSSVCRFVCPSKVTQGSDNLARILGKPPIYEISMGEKAGQTIEAQHFVKSTEINEDTDVPSNLCAACKKVVVYLDEGMNNSKAVVRSALHQLCHLFFGEHGQQQCDDAADEYADVMIKTLGNIFDPDYVCLHLGLCKPGDKTPALLGANPCTWGPDYWCKNLKNAVECKAVEHCQQHVWE